MKQAGLYWKKGVGILVLVIGCTFLTARYLPAGEPGKLNPAPVEKGKVVRSSAGEPAKPGSSTQLARREQLEEMGMLQMPKQAGFDLLNNSSIPQEFLEKNGLKENDRAAIKKITDKFVDRIDREFVARMKPGERSGDGSTTYFIPADPDSVREAISVMKADLRSRFGGAAADELLRGLQRTQYLAAFGFLDMSIKIHDGPGDGGGDEVQDYVTYSSIDPATGQRVRGSMMPKRYFAPSFRGHLFPKLIRE